MDCRDDEDRVLGNEHRCTPMHTDEFWLCVYVVYILHFAPETVTKEMALLNLVMNYVCIHFCSSMPNHYCRDVAMLRLFGVGHWFFPLPITHYLNFISIFKG